MTFVDYSLAFGLLSAVLGCYAFAIYILGTLRGTTRPLTSTWLIWSVLASLSLASNVAEGASTSLPFVATQALCTIMVFVLAIYKGAGGFLQAKDLLPLSLAGIGLLAWWMTDNPVWALGFSIGISAVGGVATIAKTYRAPSTECRTCWSVSLLAALAGSLSVGASDPVLLAYPAYLALLYGGILLAILLGKRSAPLPLVLAPEFRIAARQPYRRSHRRAPAHGHPFELTSV